MNTVKKELAERGIGLCVRFCDINDLPEPEFTLLDKNDRFYKLNSCGFYRRDNGVNVMVDKCAALGHAGRCWSWPGHMIDRTPFGVVCHEVGHYVHDTVLNWSTRIQKQSGEVKLTNYCPNSDEWFAEMFRLFLTNPDLLKRVRPKTYALLAYVFEPAEKRSWQKVMSGAPERTILLLEKRTEKC